ncbi:MAG TPA: hypothetical protein VFJ91_08805 [Gaiellaceae bacterium]|nr:hypothetical protein [Gaiellaceae bacterium]
MERTTPELLLRRLDEIGASLARRDDAVALLGLGSVGLDTHRLDEHSDLDFFAVVEAEALPRYLDSIDWLEDAHPVAYSFRNTRDGRKALFADGVWCEYAVFAPAQLAEIPFARGRIVWQRADAPAGLDTPSRRPPSLEGSDRDFHANEALTQLYVGLHRELRGERLSAMRLIQVHAVERAIALLALERPEAPQQDPFAAERGVELRFGADELPLAEFVQGYDRNRESALALLAWLEAHADPDATLAAEIRRLAAT